MKIILKRRSVTLICLLCSLAGCCFAQHADFRVIPTQVNSTVVSPASAGILAGETLYVSGQGSKKPDGSIPAGLQDQVSQALHNVRAVLQGARMDYPDIVSMNVYLTKTEDQAVFDEVYWKTIDKDPPARTVITVAALPNGDRIEINCIAVPRSVSRKAVWPEGWPKGDRRDPPAILAGDVLYFSAQGGRDPLTGKERPDFSAEVTQALENVKSIAAAANMSMKNVVWVNPYMSAEGKYDVMGKVYARYFEFGNTPGRGTIQVVGLPGRDHIVFSCIAGADLNKRKAIRPLNMPPSPTASPGILYGDTLYLSAKDGFIPDQGMVTPDLILQARQSMRNLLDGLQEADMDFSNVVASTIYMRDIKDADRESELYEKFFHKVYPASSLIQQNFDSTEEAAEQISFIAVRHPHPVAPGDRTENR